MRLRNMDSVEQNWTINSEMKFVGLEKRYLTIRNAALIYAALFLCNIISGYYLFLHTFYEKNYKDKIHGVS